MRPLRLALAVSLLAFPAAAQLGLSPEGFEGLKVKVRPLGAAFKPEGGQGNDTALAGSVGSGVPIDGFAMRHFRVKLEYQALVDGQGWSPWKKAPEEVGVAGKKVLGVKARVERGSIRYRVAMTGGDFTAWMKDGEPADAAPGKAVEALEVEFLNIAREGQTFEYRVAWKSSEWGPWLTPDQTSEKEGADAEVTAIEFRNGGGIRCEASSRGTGWLPTVEEGRACGDPSGRLRIQAFRLFSTALPLQYRCKVEGRGWTKWKHDGDGCGEMGKARRIQGIQVQPRAAD